MTASTVLWHPDVSRVGERAWLPELEEGRPVRLSRLEPDFEPPDGSGLPRPLIDPRVSRQPIRLLPIPGGLEISTAAGPSPVEVAGERLAGKRDLSDGELDRGVPILINGRVALVLDRRPPEALRPPRFGLVGESRAILELRRQIERVLDFDAPVLVCGASGTGKELAARAIQSHGKRRGGPFVILNMAAVPATLAASELFGVVRGAYSGADRTRPGYFEQADGGTLFLDEIGEASRDAQGLLLRVLESGEIQPVGAARPRTVDVRVITATDADLDAAVRDGRFSNPLLQRLRSLEIRVPSLRQRLDDLGRLFLHFLRAELRALGDEERLRPRAPGERSYVSARLVARLATHDWPGNVRELRNVVRELVVASRGCDALSTGDWLAPSGRAEAGHPAPRAEHAPAPAPPPPSAPGEPSPPARRATTAYRDPSSVRDQELVDTLFELDWNLQATAAALGISRASLYTLIDRSDSVRKAQDLDAGEIEAALTRHEHDLAAAARTLRVSRQGLKRRVKLLGLT